MYDADGEVVWGAELSSYGDVRNLTGERTDCPFRYQGQYEDKETGLYYNRFRYYSTEEGMYISQDPIGLAGGFSLYGYVHEPNNCIDLLGLSCKEEAGKNKRLRVGSIYPGWEKIKVDYSDINPRRAGNRDFTTAQKRKIYKKNMDTHDGYLVSDQDGRILKASAKSKTGVKPSPNEAQVDHIKPKSKGGFNTGENAQVLSTK